MKKELLNFKKENGFSLLEVILSLALFAMFVTALVGAYLYGGESTALSGKRARAVMLAREGLDALRNIRDDDFANLTPGTHGLAISGSEWVLSGSSDTNDIFTRQVVISDIDANRKSATATVTWQQNLQRNGTVSVVTQFTNWMRTVAGNWANAIQEASLGLAGIQNGLKVQTQGNYAYLVRADGTPDFAVIDVTNPASPTLVGSLNLTGIPTNIFVSGNYAYVSNSDNAQELQIIDISNPVSPSVVGTYNDAGNDDARGVYVSGSYAYLVLNGGNDFVVVDVSVPASPSVVGTLVLNGTPFEVAVSGSYAYLASDDNTQEVQVVDISSPATPSLAGSLNLSSNTNATTIAFSGTNLFVGQGTSFRVVDISVPATPTLSGTLSLLGNINDIAIDTANGGAYVFVSTSGDTTEFQVIDVSAPATPVVLSSVNTAGTDDLLGVAYNATLDRAFGASASNAEEFIVFAPQ